MVSVEDLKKPEYMELFVTPDSNGKARALGCISGWSCADVNEQKIEAYGLSDSVQTQDPGSNAALDAEIIGSYEKGDDILFYYWGPTSLSNRLETEFDGFYVLEEPAYSEACWGASKGCAYATSEILIAMRSDIAEQAPDIVALLEKWNSARHPSSKRPTTSVRAMPNTPTSPHGGSRTMTCGRLGSRTTSPRRCLKGSRTLNFVDDTRP